MGYDPIRNYIQRGTLQSVDDEGGYQSVRARGMAGESFGGQKRGIMRPQPHGLSSVPLEGAEGIIISLGGFKESALFLGGESEGKRAGKGKPGSTTLYDSAGNALSLTGEKAELKTKGQPIEVDGKTITIKGAEKITLECGGVKIILKDGKILLGDESASQAVMLQSGPSTKIFGV